jgi:hypothetical protein
MSVKNRLASSAPAHRATSVISARHTQWRIVLIFCYVLYDRLRLLLDVYTKYG